MLKTILATGGFRVFTHDNINAPTDKPNTVQDTIGRAIVKKSAYIFILSDCKIINVLNSCSSKINPSVKTTINIATI